MNSLFPGSDFFPFWFPAVSSLIYRFNEKCSKYAHAFSKLGGPKSSDPSLTSSSTMVLGVAFALGLYQGLCISFNARAMVRFSKYECQDDSKSFPMHCKHHGLTNTSPPCHLALIITQEIKLSIGTTVQGRSFTRFIVVIGAFGPRPEQGHGEEGTLVLTLVYSNKMDTSTKFKIENPNPKLYFSLQRLTSDAMSAYGNTDQSEHTRTPQEICLSIFSPSQARSLNLQRHQPSFETLASSFLHVMHAERTCLLRASFLLAVLLIKEVSSFELKMGKECNRRVSFFH